MPQPITHGPRNGLVSSSGAVKSLQAGLHLDAELEISPSWGPCPGSMPKPYPFRALDNPLWYFSKLQSSLKCLKSTAVRSQASSTQSQWLILGRHTVTAYMWSGGAQKGGCSRSYKRVPAATKGSCGNKGFLRQQSTAAQHHGTQALRSPLRHTGP